MTIFAFALLANACVTTAPQVGYGVQAGHTSYVPARIAILPCTQWPEGARFLDLPLTNVKPAEIKDLCSGVDKFVLAGFNDQPFMKGFSPAFVAEGLAESGDEGLLASLPTVWSHRASDCHDCANAPSFYTASVASRPDWLSWLNTLSEAVHNADAVLMPFVAYGFERHYEDRGLQVAERGSGATLLLIDTNNGTLLWAGGRDAAATNKRLDDGATPANLALPPWSEVQERLLVENLWKDFPGRQVY